jgi:pSer/pThr/pTyr-binding forkhead associated (FHA) protein
MPRLTLSFKDKKLKIFPLSQPRVLVGRADNADIQIDSLAVEPRHLRIVRGEQGYVLETLSPKAQVKVNGEPVTEHYLQDGDQIQVGKHTLSFSLESASAIEDVPAADALHQVPATGWLQIQSGSHLGRTIRLDKALTRVGKRSVGVAVIARRNDGYFLSHLEGPQPPAVNGVDLAEDTHRLHDQDRIRIGRLELQFFVDDEEQEEEPARSETLDQRRFSRVPFQVEVTLHRADRRWTSRLLDISLHGALIERPPNWSGEEGLPHRLDVHLDGGVVISMDVQVAHSDNSRLGLSCEDIDVDSITHLRRLVELNLGDAELVERELHALG